MTQLEELYAAHVSTLVDRTRLALEATGYERVVIHAGDVVQKSRFDDSEWPFRPVPAYAHWVPWPWPGSALVVERGRAARLFARVRKDFWESWEAPDADLVRSGLDVVEVTDLEPVRELGKRSGSAFIGESTAAGLQLGLEKRSINPHELVDALHEARVHKTPYEIECIASANRRAAVGHRAVREAFYAGERSELALHLNYLSATEQDDPDTAYKNIVALGEAGSILHHHGYRSRPAARSLLVDAGAVVLGYNSDITRTYIAPEDPSGFGALVQAMDSLQQTVCGRVRAGEGYETLHDEAHRLLGALLVEQGLVSCSVEAAVAEGLTRVFFPHGLGHSLGVQVHDVGCRKNPPRAENPWLRNTRTVEPGQVFTIEPGLYFIDGLLEPLRDTPPGQSVRWDRVEPLRPYGGIRIEDNVLVLEANSRSPVRNLTREAFAAA